MNPKDQLIAAVVATTEAHHTLAAAIEGGDAVTIAHAEAQLAAAEQKQAVVERVIDRLLSRRPEALMYDAIVAACTSKEDRMALAHRQYTDPDSMRVRLTARPWEADQCLKLALDPCGRFGLTAEETAGVIPTIREFLEA